MYGYFGSMKYKTLASVHRHSLIGTRIELPVHYDKWMMGARYGVITSMRHGRDGFSDYAMVKLDALPVKARRVKLWLHDFGYAKLASI